MKKTRLTLLSILAILVIALSLVGCTKNTTSKKFTIVATNFPCYDFARNIIQPIQDNGKASKFQNNDFELKLLIKPGMELHSYDPTPADVIAIQNADLFIYIGGESDEWVNDILSATNKSPNSILCLSNYVNQLEEVVVEGMEEEDEHDHEDDEHGHDDEHNHEEAENEHEIDEHIWTSAENAIIMTNTIKDSLISLDTEKNEGKNKDAFIQNANLFCSQISNYSNQIQSIVDNSKTKYIIMGDRFPLRYFAEEYNLSYSAAFVGCSSAVEAKTSTIAYLINKAKEENVGAIYSIELSNQKIAKTIAEEMKLPVLVLHSCHNVSKSDFDDGFTYITAMQNNIDSLKIGLK